MVNRRLRVVVCACGVAALMLAMAGESRACCLLDRLFGCGSWGAARRTYPVYYAPPSCGPACCPAPACGPASCPPSLGCDPCASPCAQTTYYVPQTCYRTVVQRVPLTTYRASLSCDPCSGCPVTAYRPVTCWTTRRSLVPYTTYRVQYAAAYSPAVGCATYGACATCPSPCASCPSPAAAYPSTYSSCPGGVCPTTAYSISSSCCVADTAPAASVNGSNGAAVQPRTFAEPERGAGPQTQLEPIPDTSARPNSMPVAPQLIDPDNRTTTRSRQPVARIHLVASSAPLVPVKAAPVDDGGWRPSRD